MDPSQNPTQPENNQQPNENLDQPQIQKSPVSEIPSSEQTTNLNNSTPQPIPAVVAEANINNPVVGSKPKKSHKKLIIISAIVGSVVLLLLFLGTVIFVINNVNSVVNSSDNLTDSQITAASNIVADKQAKDLYWQDITKNANGWTKISSETGTTVYQLNDTKCGVTIDQPAGMIKNNITSTKKVAQDFTNNLAKGIKVDSSKFSVTQVSPILFSVDTGEPAKMTFDTYKIATEDNQTTGLVAVYINGDYALIASGVCGQGEGEAHLNNRVKDFMSSFKAVIIY